jgi:hypothetical protein
MSALALFDRHRCRVAPGAVVVPVSNPCSFYQLLFTHDCQDVACLLFRALLTEKFAVNLPESLNFLLIQAIASINVRAVQLAINMLVRDTLLAIFQILASRLGAQSFTIF